jgi:predicted nucleic acid-binding protein
VLAAAIYGLADYILTVDRDLLTKDIVAKLKQVGVEIISSDDLILLLDADNG